MSTPIKKDSSLQGLQWDKLKPLFEATDWSLVRRERSVEETYGKNPISTISYFKAWTLPYLYPLTEERYLAEELAERELLQELCEFTASRIPTHNMLRHFRHKYQSVFPIILRRLLVSMAIAAHQQSLLLPFARIEEEVKHQPEGIGESFRLEKPDGNPYVFLWTSENIQGRIGEGIHTRPTDKLFVGVLKLPAEAYVQVNTKKQAFPEKQEFNLVLDKPIWLHNRISEPITSLGPAHIKQPYTACKVIVERKWEGRKQILLSKRLAGFGAGEYELPGGKCGPEDGSIEECAIRELRQETGLILRSSRPVSINTTRYPGKPLVKSIGVLALEYDGKVRHREELLNTPWTWYDLNDLPKPLFDPSRLVIEDYIKKRFPDRQWSDMEEKQPQQLSFRL